MRIRRKNEGRGRKLQKGKENVKAQLRSSQAK
jgi:hypothetical protein